MRNFIKISMMCLTTIISLVRSQMVAAESGPAPQPAPYVGLESPTPGAAVLGDEAQIRETISRFTRVTDTRDVDAASKVFAPDVAASFYERKEDGTVVLRGKVTHSIESIKKDLEKLKLADVKTKERSHHFTNDPIIEIHGDIAHFNAHFLVTHAKPAENIPDGAVGVFGSFRVTLTGYYDEVLKKVNGHWLISEHRVICDVPFKTGFDDD